MEARWSDSCARGAAAAAQVQRAGLRDAAWRPARGKRQPYLRRRQVVGVLLPAGSASSPSPASSHALPSPPSHPCAQAHLLEDLDVGGVAPEDDLGPVAARAPPRARARPARTRAGWQAVAAVAGQALAGQVHGQAGRAAAQAAVVAATTAHREPALCSSSCVQQLTCRAGCARRPPAGRRPPRAPRAPSAPR